MTPTRSDTCVVGKFTVRYVTDVRVRPQTILYCNYYYYYYYYYYLPTDYHRIVTLQPISVRNVFILDIPDTKQKSEGAVCPADQSANRTT